MEVFAATNHSDETITVVLATGFKPDCVSLGGVLIPTDPKQSGMMATEHLPRVHVAQTVGIVWIDGAHSMGSPEQTAAPEHRQDVPIPDEFLAKHTDREDILSFTFGPDKKWTVKLVPRAERGW